MAAAPDSLPDLLENLTSSLASATSAFPTDHKTLLPPADGKGISLLDVKNELLLSYLQNLVFLIVVKLRNDPENAIISAEATKKLHEQRVYLEKGVRPLESRLKYQIDKVLRAADDAERRLATRKVVSSKKTNGTVLNGDANSDASDSDSVSQAPASDTEAHAASDLSRRPDLTLHKTAPSTTKSPKSTLNGTYKPPRITPTSMPSTTRTEPRTRNRKSHLIDEYIANDLSSAPQAQPSIGSNNTILDRGRGGMSARERETERERTRYEEANMTRLPTMTKAEKRKARGGDQRDVFGGEDWTGLGGLGDRVSRSVGGKGKGVLERREKRKRDTGDSVRGDGHNLGIGESFEKRRKVLQGRMGKGKGKRR
jgi:U3 small nucleolar ribonucleoprotein protein LCP5